MHTDWLANLLQGGLTALISGAVAAVTAWGLYRATRRLERQLAREAEARAAAVRVMEACYAFHDAWTLSYGITEHEAATSERRTVARRWLQQARASASVIGLADPDLARYIDGAALLSYRQAHELIPGPDPDDDAETNEREIIAVLFRQVDEIANQVAEWLLKQSDKK